MSRARREFLPGTLDMLIMRALAVGPMHGYGVARWIESRTDDLLQIEEGSLYPSLHRMERREWIEASWGLSANNRRAKYYRLTAAGRRRLSSEAEEWEKFARAVRMVLRPAGA
jgi:PadR family transcriptional regulator